MNTNENPNFVTTFIWKLFLWIIFQGKGLKSPIMFREKGGKKFDLKLKNQTSNLKNRVVFPNIYYLKIEY